MPGRPLRISAALFLALVSLASCGKDDGSHGTTPPAATLTTGTFVESPVDGLHYTSPPSNSAGGWTANGGQYQCQPGDTVIFDLGGRPIGTGQPCGPRVTMSSVFGATSIADTRVINLAQVLLTLGGIPSGPHAIQVPPTIPADLPNPLDFSDPDFTVILQSALPGTTLVTKAQALAYLHTSTNTLPPMAAVTSEPVTPNPASLPSTDGLTKMAGPLTATGTGIPWLNATGCSGPGPCQMVDATGARAVLLSPPPGFTLRTSRASIAAPRNASGQLRVLVERQGGFNSPIELDVVDPPDGISASPVIVEDDDEAQLPVHIAADVPIGGLPLVIQGTGGGVTVTATVQLSVQAAQPSALQLIHAAHKAGLINYGTSLLYRAYALFGSARLPEALVGSGPEEDHALFDDIERARPTLPPASLTALQPFLLRPADPQSIYNIGHSTASPQRLTAALVDPGPARIEKCSGKTHEWITSRSSTFPVRAWALCNGTPAGNARARLNIDKVLKVVDQTYGKMTDLMGPAQPDEWSDDLIDVFVVPPNTDVPRLLGDSRLGPNVRGRTEIAPPVNTNFGGHGSSAYVKLSTSTMAERDYQLPVVHELFHVLQAAQNVLVLRKPFWFKEASAKWAELYFNRITPLTPVANAHIHEGFFGYYQSSPGSLLRTEDKVLPYAAYIWPFFMEQEKGSGELIGRAWLLIGAPLVDTAEEATEVLNGLLPFNTTFRKFAVRNVNEFLFPGDPVTPRYKAQDSTFPEGKRWQPIYDTMRLTGDTPVTRNLSIEPLAAEYLQVDVTSGVRSVEFDFSGLSGREHLDIDALIQTSTGWLPKPVPLDGDPKPRFCFDLGPATDKVRGEFIQLRLVLSNHAFVFGNNVNGSVTVRPSRDGCAGVWSGTMLRVVDFGDKGKITTKVTGTFEADKDESTPEVTIFKLRGGRLSYRSEDISSCTLLATAEIEMVPLAPFPAPPTVGATESRIIFSNGSIMSYTLGPGGTYGHLTFTDCHGKVTTLGDQFIPWWISPIISYTVKNDGTLMEEDITVGNTRHQWSLRRVGN